MIALIDNDGYENLIETINEKSGTEGVHNISELNNLVKNMGGGDYKNAESVMEFIAKDASASVEFYVIDPTVNKDIELFNETEGERFEIEIKKAKRYRICLSEGCRYRLTIPDSYNVCDIYIESVCFKSIKFGCPVINKMYGERFVDSTAVRSAGEKIEFGSSCDHISRSMIGDDHLFVENEYCVIDLNNIKRIDIELEIKNNLFNDDNGTASRLIWGDTIKSVKTLNLYSINTELPKKFCIPSSVESIGHINIFSNGCTCAETIQIGDSENKSSLKSVRYDFLGDQSSNECRTIICYASQVPYIFSGEDSYFEYTNVHDIYVLDDLFYIPEGGTEETCEYLDEKYCWINAFPNANYHKVSELINSTSE